MSSVDYKTLLQDHFAQAYELAFGWGEHDCCTFSMDYVKAVTGIDLIQWARGQYSSEEEATSLLLKRTRRKSLKGALLRMLTVECNKAGFQEVTIPFMQSGDLCVVTTDQGDAAALAHNGHAWTTSPDGLIVLSNVSIIKVWRIPKCQV